MRRMFVLALLAGSAPAAAQKAFLLNDRTNDAIYRVADLNGDGFINEPGEVRLWFNAANVAGTIGPSNPTCLSTRPDGLAVMGDQGLGVIFRLRDLNGDGDAQDPGESLVAADATNASGVSFAFPTGAAFDPLGILYIVNAGNAFGNDAIYKLVDLNGDGDFQDPGEITEWVGAGAFGPGNGPYSPQEILFLPTAVFPVGLVRNSSTGLHGVYRFADLNGNGRADDPGEFFAYFDATNASGITPSAGFALELDAADPSSVYMLQTATGSLDQLIRLTDIDGDNKAQSAGEAVVVFETAEPGFTSIDVVSLADGRVLITDNSGKRVIVLKDLDGDGKFMSPGERAGYFSNSSALVGDIRQMSPILFMCYPDCNGDGVLGLADFGCFQTKFALNDPYADCNGDGVLGLADFGCFQTKFALGCP
jgi:hypothetical protein